MKSFFAAFTPPVNEAILIRENKEAVDRSNKVVIGFLLRIHLIIFTLLSILSLFVPGYTHLTFFYLTALVLFLIFIFLDGCITAAHYSLGELYFYVTAFFVYSVLSSAFFTPNALSIIFLLVMLEMQLLVTDRTIHINVVMLLYAVIYCVFMVLFKEKQFMYDEIVNVWVLVIISSLLGSYLRHTKLINLDLQRQSEKRERIDFLTGLHSRRKLFEDLADSESENGHPFTGAMMLDVDLFKQYNDTYGHRAGDECLRKIGDCLVRFGHAHELSFYRFGGEEFTAFSTHHSLEELCRLGDALGREIAALAIPHSALPNGIVSVSIGVSAKQVGEHYNPEHLIEEADTALYYAKRNGRAQTVAFADFMMAQALQTPQ